MAHKIAPERNKQVNVEEIFAVQNQYRRCFESLRCCGIVTFLPRCESPGIKGIDGKEYPIPTLAEVRDIVAANAGLVARKRAQGFVRLELIPMAMPLSGLVAKLNHQILVHSEQQRIFRTRMSVYDPNIAVRVNKTKQVWVWKELQQAFDEDDLVYFPRQYSSHHEGLTKAAVIKDQRFCAVPGWSVGLVEDMSFIPAQGRGHTIGSRKQLETGSSPLEYLTQLKGHHYDGETGKTLEDFITEFMVRLITRNEVSNDVEDHNALWCLGQYMKTSYARLVPTGRWFREVGRVRLDMHRTANRRCTKNWGASTVVRLHGK